MEVNHLEAFEKTICCRREEVATIFIMDVSFNVSYRAIILSGNGDEGCQYRM